MALDPVNATVEIPLEIFNGILHDVGVISYYLQALGILALLWIISYVITLFAERKRARQIKEIQLHMKRLEMKIDKILENNRKSNQ